MSSPGNTGNTHAGRKRRDVNGELVPTETRRCLRCRKPFESEGPHNRMCNGCRNSDVSPYAL